MERASRRFQLLTQENEREIKVITRFHDSLWAKCRQRRQLASKKKMDSGVTAPLFMKEAVKSAVGGELRLFFGGILSSASTRLSWPPRAPERRPLRPMNRTSQLEFKKNRL